MTRVLKVRFAMHCVQRSPSGTMHGSSDAAEKGRTGTFRLRLACVMHLARGTCS